MAQTHKTLDESDYLLSKVAEAICDLLPLLSDWLPSDWSTEYQIHESGADRSRMEPVQGLSLASEGARTFNEVFFHNINGLTAAYDNAERLQRAHWELGKIVFSLSPQFVAPWAKDGKHFGISCFDGMGYQIRHSWADGNGPLTPSEADERYRFIFDTKSQAEERLKEWILNTGVDTYSVQTVIYAANRVPDRAGQRDTICGAASGTRDVGGARNWISFRAITRLTAYESYFLER